MQPQAGSRNLERYSGMLADLFITAESEEGVEERARQYLEGQGWVIQSFEHAERVPHPSTHDQRFNKLWQDAQRDGIAAFLSPY